jgi:hypothetical protein
MCNFFSCIVMKNKRVVWEAGINNHHEIVEKYEIPDSEEDQQKMQFARVEILPPNNEDGVFDKNISNWTLTVDERIRPEWFSPAHGKAAICALEECLSSVVIDGITVDTIKGKKGLLIRNAIIKNLGSSTVQKMWGSSTVQEMWDSSTVQEMWGSSTVQKMWGSSTVQEMWDSSTVQEMWGSSTVQKMRDSSTVQEMWDSSTANVYSDKATIGKILSKMAVAVCRLAGKMFFKIMDED